jgi:hypothetical protein
VELIQIMLLFENHVIGISTIVGIIIFSFVRGLGFAHSPFCLVALPCIYVIIPPKYIYSEMSKR